MRRLRKRNLLARLRVGVAPARFKAAVRWLFRSLGWICCQEKVEKKVTQPILPRTSPASRDDLCAVFNELQGSPDHCRTSLYSKTFCRKNVSQKTFLNFQKCCQVYQYFDRRRDQSIWIVSVATATLAEELREEYAGAAPPALPGRGRPRRAAGPCCFGSPPRGDKRSEVLLLLDLGTFVAS